MSSVIIVAGEFVYFGKPTVWPDTLRAAQTQQSYLLFVVFSLRIVDMARLLSRYPERRQRNQATRRFGFAWWFRAKISPEFNSLR